MIISTVFSLFKEYVCIQKVKTKSQVVVDEVRSPPWMHTQPFILPQSSSACMHRDNSATHDDPDSAQIDKLVFSERIPAEGIIQSQRSE